MEISLTGIWVKIARHLIYWNKFLLEEFKEIVWQPALAILRSRADMLINFVSRNFKYRQTAFQIHVRFNFQAWTNLRIRFYLPKFWKMSDILFEITMFRIKRQKIKVNRNIALSNWASIVSHLTTNYAWLNSLFGSMSSFFTIKSSNNCLFNRKRWNLQKLRQFAFKWNLRLVAD